MPNGGFVWAREKLAAHLSKEQGVALTTDDVLLGCGAAGVLNAFLRAVINPGEEMLGFAPYFVEYGFYVANHGGTFRAVMGTAYTKATNATTNYTTSSPVARVSTQDGYPEGSLSNISITADGTVVGKYSNNQSANLWQIPVCRFTSEDGLRREGNNLFSATDDAGAMEMGTAGTENYGKINAYNIENSNVDMASEMVNMIVTQRGFQSNSKVVTTADQMLQKAMELKRS